MRGTKEEWRPPLHKSCTPGRDVRLRRDPPAAPCREADSHPVSDAVTAADGLQMIPPPHVSWDTPFRLQKRKCKRQTRSESNEVKHAYEINHIQTKCRPQRSDKIEAHREHNLQRSVIDAASLVDACFNITCRLGISSDPDRHLTGSMLTGIGDLGATDSSGRLTPRLQLAPALTAGSLPHRLVRACKPSRQQTKHAAEIINLVFVENK